MSQLTLAPAPGTSNRGAGPHKIREVASRIRWTGKRTLTPATGQLAHAAQPLHAAQALFCVMRGVSVLLRSVPAYAILRLKTWVHSWMSYTAQIGALDLTRCGDKVAHLSPYALLGFFGARVRQLSVHYRRIRLGLIVTAGIARISRRWASDLSPSAADIIARRLGTTPVCRNMRQAPHHNFNN